MPLAANHVPEETDDALGSLIRLPPGFFLVPAYDSSSTLSGILGPGRLVGSLFSSAGRRLEKLIDRVAERRLGLGPNMAALRLTTALYSYHVDQQVERVRRREFSESGAAIGSETDRLIWVCNGFCSQCGKPYLEDPLNKIPESVRKLLLELMSHIKSVDLLPIFNLYIAQSSPLHQFCCTTLQYHTCRDVHPPSDRFPSVVRITHEGSQSIWDT
jgi:hypothetical protein